MAVGTPDIGKSGDHVGDRELGGLDGGRVVGGTSALRERRRTLKLRKKLFCFLISLSAQGLNLPALVPRPSESWPL